MKTVHAATKDAVFQASIEFIGTLTGMTPPPIEIAPAETFKPFADFTNLVCEIFEKQIIVELTKERDAYEKCADTMAAAHKVERDDLSARYETASRLVTSLSDALGKALKERDALKDAARLALDALLAEVRTTANQITYTNLLTVIAALKAVL